MKRKAPLNDERGFCLRIQSRPKGRSLGRRISSGSAAAGEFDGLADVGGGREFHQGGLGIGGDVEVGTGDLTYTESTGQHKRDLLLADKGHFKENPDRGVGAFNFLGDSDPEEFYRTVRKECSKDGMKVKDVKRSGGDLIIDAKYENGNS